MRPTELRAMQDINVEDLNADFIHATPVDRDWSEGYPERWEYAEPETCEECETICIQRAGFIECPNEDCPNFEDQVDTYGDGPMMNYAYPISELSDDEIAELIHLPLVYITHEDGTTELALSGGGMDLSWEICEAYIRLGFLPPAHFTGLPRMADRGTSERDKTILAACRRTLEVAQRQLGARANELEGF